MAQRVHSSPSSPEPATNFTYLSFKSELRDSRLKLPDTDEDKTNGGRENPKHLCAKLQYLGNSVKLVILRRGASI